MRFVIPFVVAVYEYVVKNDSTFFGIFLNTSHMFLDKPGDFLVLSDYLLLGTEHAHHV